MKAAAALPQTKPQFFPPACTRSEHLSRNLSSQKKSHNQPLLQNKSDTLKPNVLPGKEAGQSRTVDGHGKKRQKDNVLAVMFGILKQNEQNNSDNLEQVNMTVSTHRNLFNHAGPARVSITIVQDYNQCSRDDISFYSLHSASSSKPGTIYVKSVQIVSPLWNV